MIVQIKNPEHFIKNQNLLELINEFSKVIVYKINTLKSIGSPDICNEHVDIKTENTIPLTISEKNEILCISLENMYRTCMLKTIQIDERNQTFYINGEMYHLVDWKTQCGTGP